MWHLASSSRSPFGHSLRSCPLSPHAGTALSIFVNNSGQAATFPARGESFWVVLPPACPERGGGCECNEQTEGLHRGCCYLRQPLSLTSFDSSPAGEPFGLPQTKSCPRKRGKWHGEAMTKGERLGTAKLFFYSPSVGLRRQLPRKRWSLLVLPPSPPYPWAEHEYEREYLKATE